MTSSSSSSALLRRSRVCYVGNLASSTTRDELVDFLSRAGPVTGARVVIDKTSGRGRGFGFCEFADSEYAANAVRSLNGTEFQGRVIRIDFSDSERAKSQTEANALRVGPNAIKATVNSINRRELLESLQDMQEIYSRDPDQAHRILKENPAVSVALLEGLRVFQVIDESQSDQMMGGRDTLRQSSELSRNETSTMSAPVRSASGSNRSNASGIPLPGIHPPPGIPSRIPSSAGLGIAATFSKPPLLSSYSSVNQMVPFPSASLSSRPATIPTMVPYPMDSTMLAPSVIPGQLGSNTFGSSMTPGQGNFAPMAVFPPPGSNQPSVGSSFPQASLMEAEGLLTKLIQAGITADQWDSLLQLTNDQLQQLPDPKLRESITLLQTLPRDLIAQFGSSSKSLSSSTSQLPNRPSFQGSWF